MNSIPQTPGSGGVIEIQLKTDSSQSPFFLFLRLVTHGFSKLVCTAMFWLSLWHQGDKESGSCNQNYRFYRTNPILNPDFSVFSRWSDIGRLVFAFKHNSTPDPTNEVQ